MIKLEGSMSTERRLGHHQRTSSQDRGRIGSGTTRFQRDWSVVKRRIIGTMAGLHDVRVIVFEPGRTLPDRTSTSNEMT